MFERLSLTPALSRWERENYPPNFEMSDDGSGSLLHLQTPFLPNFYRSFGHGDFFALGDGGFIAHEGGDHGWWLKAWQ
jgi:hypothetical protein